MRRSILPALVVLLCAGSLLAQQDDFRVDSYPDYYVIDRAGNLRIADMANAELDRVVEILLKEKP